MTRKYLVARTTPDGTQYLIPPGIWQSSREKAQRFPFNEACWLAFTSSTARQPARAVPDTEQPR